MIEGMSTVRISESELARDVHAVLEKVQQGVDVIIEQNHRPIAVIKASPPAGRKISEVIASLEASGANAVLDEEFERDVEEAIQSYREPWNPPSGD
jgi:antitoxin (DNA-binding transcriptional repressor) of toxin-antitoxin stability system